MRKGIKIIIILTIIILIGFAIYIVINNIQKKDNSSNDASDKTSKVISDEEYNYIQEESNENHDDGTNLKLIKISTENKIRVLSYLKTKEFSSIYDLEDGEILDSIFMGIHNGWINLEYVDNSEEGIFYKKEDIDNAIFSIYCGKIENGTTTNIVKYKDGMYYYSIGDGDPIPEVYNIQSSKNQEMEYYIYNVVNEENVGIYYTGEQYEVGVEKGFIKSKRAVTKGIFDSVEFFSYDKTAPESGLNALVTIIKAGETSFITNQENGVYVYVDEIGNRYEYKSIESISVDNDTVISTDGKLVLFRCSINYIPKDSNEEDIKSIQIALVMSNDFSDYEIHAPYYDYIKTTDFTNNF